MSFNIRYRQADDRGNRWDRRKALVVARIRAFDPDLLGIQECADDAQAAYLKRHLKGWEFHGIRTEDPGWPFEMAPILFKRDAFEQVDEGCFWLSARPAVPGSTSWGGAFARTAACAQLRHRATGRSLVFLNTHVDYEAKAVEKSAAPPATLDRQDRTTAAGCCHRRLQRRQRHHGVPTTRLRRHAVPLGSLSDNGGPSVEGRYRVDPEAFAQGGYNRSLRFTSRKRLETKP